ncbi:toll/interleukin-1 receptor domain-containing protein [Desulfobacter postgatei]|uniref:TIR domain-containing protein n=1 Tax=Desulfobacter postgatei 2ac9 TaxID=879212 RepID=I5B139_9BACT|nr:toll/interleukin-1 receptor domain-containing protein [Desulfobacter postgatei]EIM63202.1 hypothetical protein DespoDRAFT_01238 [Desulfobacter postgatei 2ac9]
MPSKEIFISHAAGNKKIADLLVDLMETGIGIPDSKIFCSSLEGIGIPSGKNFVQFIKEQISNPKVVILLLTSEYFKSIFCQCELGASWILSHNIIPLLVPPLNYEDMKAVLTGIHARKIDDKSALSEIRDELIDLLDIKAKSSAKWEMKRKKFLHELDQYLKSYTPIAPISQDKFDKIQKNYEEAIQEMEAMEDEIERKNEIIKKLKLAKDAKEANKILIESLDLPEQFVQLIKNVEKAFQKIPSIVCEGLFYHSRGERLMWPRNDRYKKDQIQDAVVEEYFEDWEEDGLEINENDPKTMNAIEALKELETFINDITSSDEPIEEHEAFIEFYTVKHEHQLKFTSKQFWDTHLL